MFDLTWLWNAIANVLGIPVFVLTIMAGLVFGTGCAELEKNQMTQAAKGMSGDISKALSAGIENGVRDFQAQAGVQAINPRYHFNATVHVGTSVIVDGYVGIEGISGQLQAAAASGRDTLPEPASQPISALPPGARILETICIPPDPNAPDDCIQQELDSLRDPGIPEKVAANE